MDVERQVVMTTLLVFVWLLYRPATAEDIRLAFQVADKKRQRVLEPADMDTMVSSLDGDERAALSSQYVPIKFHAHVHCKLCSRCWVMTGTHCSGSVWFMFSAFDQMELQVRNVMSPTTAVVLL